MVKVLSSHKREKPLVTVVTTCYKNYQYIFDAINSVASQDYPNIEYIITDDGCDCCPVERIKEVIAATKSSTGMNIIFLTSSQNVGTVKNAIKAFRQGTGKYIIPLSHDDLFFDSHVISDIVDYFEKTNCDMISGLRLAVTEDLTPVRFKPSKHYQTIIKHKLVTSKSQLEAIVAGPHYEMASGSTMYYRRSVWERLGFDERYILWEDGPFIKKFTQSGGQFHFMFDRICIKYRLGGMSTGSVSNPILTQDNISFKLNCWNELNASNEIGWTAKRKLRQECLWISHKHRLRYAMYQYFLKLLLALIFPDVSFCRLVDKYDRYLSNKERVSEKDINAIIKG